MKSRYSSESTHSAPRHLAHPPTKEETASLLARATENPHANDILIVFNLILHTGLRVGELRELKWSQVDLDGQQLTIPSTKVFRTLRVPLRPEITAMLRHRSISTRHSEYVLGDSPGKVVRKASGALRDLSSQVCGRKLALHSLRSSFAWRLAMAIPSHCAF